MEDADKPHWLVSWISVGDIIQIAVLLAIVAASYSRLSAAQDETRLLVNGQSTLLTQLHESVDQLRTARSMTPEAAQRIAVIETRVGNLESERVDTNVRLMRIEEKIDKLREGR